MVNDKKTTNVSRKGQHRGESSSQLSPVILTQALTVLQNVVIRSATSDVNETVGTRVDDRLQLPYMGHVGASSSAMPDAVIPELHVTDLDFHTNNMPLLDEFGNAAKCSALEADVTVSNNLNYSETGAKATDTEDYRIAESIDDLFDLSHLTPPTLLTPLSGYDSGDDFESAPKKFKSSSSSSSLKGKAKAKTPRMGVGSFGKGALLKTAAAATTKQVPSGKKQSKSPNPENDDSSILKRMLSAPSSLPAAQKKLSKSGPKIQIGQIGCKWGQVKKGALTSVESAGNTAGVSGLSNAVFPAPIVARAPVVHVIDSDVEPTQVESERIQRVRSEYITIDSDVEPEVFSQATDNNVLRSYHQLKDRVTREYSMDLANVERSEETFQRLDEAFRNAQEARRVALETLERDRRALDKSSKKVRQLE